MLNTLGRRDSEAGDTHNNIKDGPEAFDYDDNDDEDDDDDQDYSRFVMRSVAPSLEK